MKYPFFTIEDWFKASLDLSGAATRGRRTTRTGRAGFSGARRALASDKTLTQVVVANAPPLTFGVEHHVRNEYLSNRRNLALGAIRLMNGSGRILGVHHDFYVAVTVFQGTARFGVLHDNAAREFHVPAILLVQFLDCFDLITGTLINRVGQIIRLVYVASVLERGNLSAVVGMQRLVDTLKGRFLTVRSGSDLGCTSCRGRGVLVNLLWSCPR